MSNQKLEFKNYLTFAESQNNTYTHRGVSPTHGYGPEIRREGTIVIHDYHRTPIHIQLSDGTSLFFTRQQYELIGGYKPERGAKMEVVMQRQSGDQSPTPSAIVKAVVTQPPTPKTRD